MNPVRIHAFRGLGMMNDGIDATAPADGTILTIRNHHGDRAPDFSARATGGAYVSYYENYHGEQWVFVRDRDADGGTLYGGDIGWDAVAVGEHALVPNLNLDAGELAWLKNAWQTSIRQAGWDTREHDLAAIAKRLADTHDSAARRRHPDSEEYKTLMVSFAYAVGYEAGQRGLTPADTDTLLRKAVEHLSAGNAES